MDKELHTSPDPDFNPSIPAKPAPDLVPPREPDAPPRAPDDEELPIPPVFPTAGKRVLSK